MRKLTQTPWKEPIVRVSDPLVIEKSVMLGTQATFVLRVYLHEGDMGR